VPNDLHVGGYALVLHVPLAVEVVEAAARHGEEAAVDEGWGSSWKQEKMDCCQVDGVADPEGPRVDGALVGDLRCAVVVEADDPEGWACPPRSPRKCGCQRSMDW
jgi:hypothetical protein